MNFRTASGDPLRQITSVASSGAGLSRSQTAADRPRIAPSTCVTTPACVVALRGVPRPLVRIFTLDLADPHALETAAVDFPQAVVGSRLDVPGSPEDGRGLSSAQQRAGVKRVWRGGQTIAEVQSPELLPPFRAERQIEPTAKPARGRSRVRVRVADEDELCLPHEPDAFTRAPLMGQRNARKHRRTAAMRPPHGNAGTSVRQRECRTWPGPPPTARAHRRVGTRRRRRQQLYPSEGGARARPWRHARPSDGRRVPRLPGFQQPSAVRHTGSSPTH